MTGLAANGNYLYLSSTSQNYAYRYTLPGIAGRLSYTFYSGYTGTRDIGWCDNGDVWVASVNPTVPLRRFNDANYCVDFIESSLVPNARGVTVDPEGNLWVSDVENDKIYKIQLDTSLSHSTWGAIKASY